MIFLNCSSYASDLEDVNIPLVVRDQPLYILIDNPQEPEPIEALPLCLRSVPKDVWRYAILPNLSFKDQLSFRGTCRYFQGHVEANPDLIQMIKLKLELQTDILSRLYEDRNLMIYIKDWEHLFKAKKRLKIRCKMSDETWLNRIHAFEWMWRLRYLPGINQEFIVNTCQLLAGDPPPEDPYDYASRKIGFLFRNYNVLKWGQGLIIVGFVLSGALAVVPSSLSPVIRIDKLPWVKFLVPPMGWINFIHSDGERPLYAINTLPTFCSTGGYCITPESLMGLNKFIWKKHTVDSVAGYVNGVTYIGYPYLLGIGLPWVMTFGWNLIKELAHPSADVNELTLGSAMKHYRRIHGSTSRTWKNYLWRGVKGMFVASLVGVMVFDIVHYLNYSKYYEDLYMKGVEALKQSYAGNYLSYASTSANNAEDFFDSVRDIVGPYMDMTERWMTCLVKFDPEVFKNNTPILVDNNLMDSPNHSWQYKNGSLQFPELWGECSGMFALLFSLNIDNIKKASSSIHIIYPVLKGVYSTTLQTEPTTFIFLGSWVLTHLYPLIIVPHVFYLLFYAVW
ncbi:MAG: hypothetical protein KBB83_07525 [Alphaproteobacteria bacterium]|nr:hypothetical protein [Alphaproteobacteria bacterium]